MATVVIATASADQRTGDTASPSTSTTALVRTAGTAVVEGKAPCPASIRSDCVPRHANWEWHLIAPHAVVSTTFTTATAAAGAAHRLSGSIARPADGCGEAILAWTIKSDGVTVAKGILDDHTAETTVDALLDGTTHAIDVVASRQDEAFCSSALTWSDQLS